MSIYGFPSLIISTPPAHAPHPNPWYAVPELEHTLNKSGLQQSTSPGTTQKAWWPKLDQGDDGPGLLDPVD